MFTWRSLGPAAIKDTAGKEEKQKRKEKSKNADKYSFKLPEACTQKSAVIRQLLKRHKINYKSVCKQKKIKTFKSHFSMQLQKQHI